LRAREAALCPPRSFLSLGLAFAPGLSLSRSHVMPASQAFSVSFHRTQEGLLAARVDKRAFLAATSKAGGVCVLSAHRLDTPPQEWRAADFCIALRHLEDETAFRRFIEELAAHERQLAALDRREIAASAVTPWGIAQQSWRFAEGVVRHSTASHGGFHLEDFRNALVHSAYRKADGWYEEDVQWAKVAATFPALFTDHERKCADETLRNFEPDAYEAVNGVVLGAGESAAKDARRFRIDHASDWIVISAILSRHRLVYVECVATHGGARRGKERRFLVPSSEYDPGRHGFVIDERRHEAYSGPSSFIGWSLR
jgi:hypothetical protein